jgi:hypothetical protein
MCTSCSCIPAERGANAKSPWHKGSCATPLMLDRTTLGPGDQDHSSLARSYLGRPQGSIHCARIAGSGGPLDIHSSLERGPTTQARFRSQQLLKDDSIRHQPGVLEHSSFSPQWLPPRGLGQPRRNGRLRNWAGGRTIDGQGQRRLVVGQLERLTGQQRVGCGSTSGRHPQPSTTITEVEH